MKRKGALYIINLLLNNGKHTKSIYKVTKSRKDSTISPEINDSIKSKLISAAIRKQIANDKLCMKWYSAKELQADFEVRVP